MRATRNTGTGLKPISVIGDTKAIKDKLKALGGKFNFRLSCGAGWIFKKSDFERVNKALNGEEEEETEFIAPDPIRNAEASSEGLTNLTDNHLMLFSPNKNEPEPTTLKDEINKTLDLFAEIDIKNTGEISESTKECFKVQGVELTAENIDKALKNYFWLYDGDTKIIEEAEKLGYVSRMSHTQAEWTQKGVNHFENTPKQYDNLKDIEEAAKSGKVISLCNLSNLVNNRRAI